VVSKLNKTADKPRVLYSQRLQNLYAIPYEKRKLEHFEQLLSAFINKPQESLPTHNGSAVNAMLVASSQ